MMDVQGIAERGNSDVNVGDDDCAAGIQGACLAHLFVPFGLARSGLVLCKFSFVVNGMKQDSRVRHKRDFRRSGSFRA